MNNLKTHFKTATLLLISLSLFFLCSCIKNPSDKTHNIDLDGDGKPEIIRVRKLKIEVLSSNGHRLGDIDIFDYSDKIRFIDLNKNTEKQIVIWTQGAEGFINSLEIYGLRNNSLYEIFKVESNSNIQTDFDAPWPQIQSDITTWVWNGTKFVER